MKNSKNNARILVVALVALFSVSFATAANADGGKNSLPVDLKYLGAANNAPIFQLSFTNENVEQYEITITDAFNTIYTETVKGKGVVRKYQFVNNELAGLSAEEDEVIVVIKNTATKNVVTYKVHPGAPAETTKELVAGL